MYRVPRKRLAVVLTVVADGAIRLLVVVPSLPSVAPLRRFASNPAPCATHRDQSNASIANGLFAAVTPRASCSWWNVLRFAALQLASGLLPFSNFDLKKL